MGGILGDNLGEGNCESKIASRQWGDNFCRETSICLAGPSGFGPLYKGNFRHKMTTIVGNRGQLPHLLRPHLDFPDRNLM